MSKEILRREKKADKKGKGQESSSSSLDPRIVKALKDDTRLVIYFYLAVHQEATLKELSDFLNKGKTTVHHHIRRLEDAEIIKWREEESDAKKLKTRYYSIDHTTIQESLGLFQDSDDLQELSVKELALKSMKAKALVNKDLLGGMIDWMTDFTEEQLGTIDVSSLNERKNSLIRMFVLTEDEMPIYEEFERKLLEAMEKRKVKQEKGEEILPVTRISTHVLVPIKEILNWKEKTSR